jgi:FAD/FMN-containing dehydrogenase
VLKLFPRPRDIATAFVAVENPQAAIDTLALLRESSGDTVTMFELMSRFSIETVLKHVPGTADPVETLSAWYALIELSSPRAGGDLQSALEEGLGAAMENGWVTDAAIAQNDSQRAAFRRIREEISDAQKHEGGSIKHDISVPLAAIPAFLERADPAIEKLIPGTRPCSFGHAGDGNLHYNLSQPVGADREAYLQQWEAANRVVHDIVQDLGGSFSAEHGIGTLKVHELEHYKSPAALEAMRQIKRALDPYAIMNPGKVIAS